MTGTAPTAAVGPAATVERVFLGWDAPALPRAAALLWERFGPDFEEVLIAVPGRRAGRRLEELLVGIAADAGRSDWTPPRIEAIGEATDQFVRVRHPVAGNLARELAWLEALRGVQRGVLRALAEGLPDGDAARGPAEWLGLAELVRRLHGELAGDGLDFAAVADSEAFPPGAREAARWHALAEIQRAYRAVLAADRLEDPHLRRLEALAERRIQGGGRLVLLGTAELNRLQRGIVEAATVRGCATLALIVAPEAEAAGFDELGCLRPTEWADRALPVPAESWSVVERPEDQAEAVISALAELAVGRSADEVVVSPAASELLAPLRRCLAAAGSGLRSPVGDELEDTPPWRLLDALAGFLGSRSVESLGELIRHSDLEAAAGAPSMGEAIAELDAYRVEHLPNAIDGYWHSPPNRHPSLRAAYDFLVQACGASMAGNTTQEIHAIAVSIRGFLQTIYGARKFDRTRESQRICAAALERLLDVLEEVARLPEGLAKTSMRPAALLHLLLRRARGVAVTPAPARERDVEQLGWLDLPLDDAPVMVVAGVQHGLIPGSVHADAFLPDALRVRLGIQDQAARTARDVYATSILYHARAADGALRLIAGRQGPDGDPWLPSSLYFHCEEEQLAERTGRAFAESAAATEFDPGGARSPYLPPTDGAWQQPPHYSASALNLFLRSRYEYFLKYVVRVVEPDRPGEELDALRFGSLLHGVLERFGLEEALRDCEDPDRIDRFLRERLEDIALQRFGRRRRATVALQLHHARARLRRFAEVQAEQVYDGWRIQAAEWSPGEDGMLEVEVGGLRIPLRGQIDRIERNERDGAWRVLDYKTGESPRAAKKDVYAARQERWKDVQLPLYRHLVAPFPGLRGTPGLGYFNLPKSARKTGVWTGAKADAAPFDEATLEQADAQVADAVRGIRAAVESRDAAFFREAGMPRDGGLAAVLAGCSYLASTTDEEEDA